MARHFDELARRPMTYAARRRPTAPDAERTRRRVLRPAFSRSSGAVRVALGFCVRRQSGVSDGSDWRCRAVAPAGSATAESCAPIHGHAFVCGAQRPEDLARIPRTRWLVFSGFSDGAGLKLVDSQARTMRAGTRASESQLEPRQAGDFGACPSPPDAALFNAQGLSLAQQSASTEHLLYVANHGGRESIEIFRIDSSADEPRAALDRLRADARGHAGQQCRDLFRRNDPGVGADAAREPPITDFVRGQDTGGVYRMATR